MSKCEHKGKIIESQQDFTAKIKCGATRVSIIEFHHCYDCGSVVKFFIDDDKDFVWRSKNEKEGKEDV